VENILSSFDKNNILEEKKVFFYVIPMPILLENLESILPKLLKIVPEMDQKVAHQKI